MDEKRKDYPPRTRSWTELDALRKILFELRRIAEMLERQFPEAKDKENPLSLGDK